MREYCVSIRMTATYGGSVFFGCPKSGGIRQG